jgi:cell division septum initiation protein DivIVA
VRKLLENSKYVGIWVWGKLRNIRNSEGKIKQEKAPEGDVLTVERPGLRIIDDKTWAAAQKRLAKLAAVYGMKKGQKPRGPRVHHTSVYPSSLLGGLLFCGECGSRLVYQTGGVDIYYGCPSHRKGVCSQATRAPREKTEQILLAFLTEEFRGIPGWLDTVMSSLRTHLEELDTRVPQELEAKSKSKADLQKMVDNITAAIESSGARSAHLLERLSEHEAKIARLEAEIAEAEAALSGSSSLPSESQIADQVAHLAEVLRGDVRPAALLLRDILGKVMVYAVVPVGKKRGFPRLKFRISGWAVAVRVLENASNNSASILATAPKGDCDTTEVVLDIGGPSRMDEQAPRIAEMRLKGVAWNEIGRLTGLGTGNAWTAWKRYTDAQRKEDAATAAG